MWKKVLTGLIGIAVIVGSLSVIEGALPEQSPIIVETVSDLPSEDEGPAAPFEAAAKSAILVDAESGEVLLKQDAHKELPMASVTKVMTMLLVMEAVENQRITLEDEVTVSERAAKMGGSQMYMEQGEVHTVAQLMEGVAVASANDGCVALAEYVAGTEEIFVERMNAKARELGMNDTHFVNTNGLPAPDHYSSAYDIAVMSMELYKYEETHKWFTTWQSTLTIGLPGKEKEFTLTNSNKLVRSYPGCNGIKTGFTREAGYCLSASATREETHLIAVVLGCETAAIRNAEIAKLLDYGFANFRSAVLAEKDQLLGYMNVDRGTPQRVPLLSGERISLLLPKGAEDTVEKEIALDESVKLPLKKGAKVGTLTLLRDGEEVGTYPVLAGTKVEKASFREMLRRIFEKDIGSKAADRDGAGSEDAESDGAEREDAESDGAEREDAESDGDEQAESGVAS